MRYLVGILLLVFVNSGATQTKPPPTPGPSPTERACGHANEITGKKGWFGRLGVDQGIGGLSIAYVPFEFKDFPQVDWNDPEKWINDPKSHKYGALPGETVFIPVDFGKNGFPEKPVLVKSEVCDYYSILNGFEAYLNGLGYTLRSDNQTTYFVKATELGPAWDALRDGQDAFADAVTDTVEGPQIHKDADADLEATYAKYGDASAVYENERDQEWDAMENPGPLGDSVIANTNPNIPSPPATLRLTSFENNFNCQDLEWGDPKLFAAELSCRQEMKYFDSDAVQAIKNGNELTGNLPNDGYVTRTFNSVDANVKVFKNNINILSAEIEAQMRQDKSLNARVVANIQGNDFMLDQDGNRYISGDPVNPPGFLVDRKVNVTVPLGIVNLNLGVGATGAVEVDYKYALSGLENLTKLKPSMAIEGYADVTVSLVVISGGVRGRVTIIEDTITAVSKFNIEDPYAPHLQYAIKQTLKNEVAALDGSLSAIVTITVPKFGIPPWTKKELEYELFRFGGYSQEGTFNALDTVHYSHQRPF